MVSRKTIVVRKTMTMVMVVEAEAVSEDVRDQHSMERLGHFKVTDNQKLFLRSADPYNVGDVALERR